jgi:hypothetical protein
MSCCTNIVWTSFNTALSQVFPSRSYCTTVHLYSFKWRYFVTRCTYKLNTLMCWDVSKESYLTVYFSLCIFITLFYRVFFSMAVTSIGRACQVDLWHYSCTLLLTIKVRINKINIHLALAHTASCLDIILVKILILFVSTGVDTVKYPS